jgi:hypothetical protein
MHPDDRQGIELWQGEGGGTLSGSVGMMKGNCEEQPYYIIGWMVHKTIILSVVLYGYETWCLEEHRLRVLENRVLRRMFGPKGMK